MAFLGPKRCVFFLAARRRRAQQSRLYGCGDEAMDTEACVCVCALVRMRVLYVLPPLLRNTRDCGWGWVLEPGSIQGIVVQHEHQDGRRV